MNLLLIFATILQCPLLVYLPQITEKEVSVTSSWRKLSIRDFDNLCPIIQQCSIQLQTCICPFQTSNNTCDNCATFDIETLFKIPGDNNILSAPAVTGYVSLAKSKQITLRLNVLIRQKESSTYEYSDKVTNVTVIDEMGAVVSKIRTRWSYDVVIKFLQPGDTQRPTGVAIPYYVWIILAIGLFCITSFIGFAIFKCYQRKHSGAPYRVLFTNVSSTAVNSPTTESRLILEDLVPSTAPLVPNLVISCIGHMERIGLAAEGLYRSTGNLALVNELFGRYVNGVDVTSLAAEADIHTFASCLKKLLMRLAEPLVPQRVWIQFVNAATELEGDSIALEQQIIQLPPANRDTLITLILHLQKVVAHAELNKMTVANLAMCFGPTIVGYSSTIFDMRKGMEDTALQIKTMEALMSMDTDRVISCFIHDA